MKPLIRRLTFSRFASATVFGGLDINFGFNLFRAQDHVCRIPLLQLRISYAARWD